MPASQPADCHGLPSSPLRPPGPAEVQLLQRGSELDLRRWPRGLVQHPGESQRWAPHHRGAAGHRPELERGAHPPDRAAEIPTAIPAGPAAGLPNSRRLRPGQLDALKQSLLGVLRQELFAPGSTGKQLWEHGLVSRLLADSSLGARTTGLLGLIETPEAMEGYVLRSQGQDDAKRRAQRCITAVQEASRLAAGRGWLS